MDWNWIFPNGHKYKANTEQPGYSPAVLLYRFSPISVYAYGLQPYFLPADKLSHPHDIFYTDIHILL